MDIYAGNGSTTTSVITEGIGNNKMGSFTIPGADPKRTMLVLCRTQ